MANREDEPGVPTEPGLPPVLELRGVGRRFGGIRALESIDLEVGGGEVVGLMGDNGAGKSTLLKVVAGIFRPSAGELWVGGKRVQFSRPWDARQAGIEVVYQDLALCENLSAAANIFLGRELRRRLFGLLPVLDSGAMEERAAVLFRQLGSTTPARALVRELSGGQRQAVAIARTRLSQPRIVLLDEPTAAISVRQVTEVLGLIRGLQQEGIAVVLVSHRMDDVFAVSDRIVVLRRGRRVAELEAAATSPEEVARFITGSAPA